MFDSNDRIGTWIHVYSFPNVNEDVLCSVFACLLLFYGFAFCLTNLSEMYKWTFFKIKIKKNYRYYYYYYFMFELFERRFIFYMNIQ